MGLFIFTFPSIELFSWTIQICNGHPDNLFSSSKCNISPLITVTELVIRIFSDSIAIVGRGADIFANDGILPNAPRN